MTDRQSDDLYDALRDRLADYGQEPPAPLWVSIRAQLPPPVAAPQLRQRARRRRLAALALLIVLASVGTWQWWRPDGRPAGYPATRVAITHPAPATSLPMGWTSAAGRRSAAERTVPGPNNTIRQTSADTGAFSVVVAGRPAEGSLHQPAIPKAKVARASSHYRFPAAAAFASKLHPKVLATERAPDAEAEIVTRAARHTGRDMLAARALALPTSADVWAVAGAHNHRPTGAQFPARAPNTTTSSEYPARAAAQPAVPATAEYPPVKTLAKTLAKTLVAAGREWPPLVAGPAQANWQPARPRVTALVLQPSGAPGRLVRADTLPTLPVAAVRRWAVQVVAGPALTTRMLGTGQLDYTAVPNSSFSPIINNPGRITLSTSSAGNERAAASFGAEAQLQRQLNGRWSLSTGLGYHVFATTQTVQVRIVYGSPAAGNFLPDSVSSVAVRNTYQFLTVPLRVGYQLGSGSPHLRYGLRMGADVALYLGGRSTEGSAYRPLNLALSLGAEVRYQLAPNWELLAQPTLTHFVTSVARPSLGYGPRYPLAISGLVGIAYWLR